MKIKVTKHHVSEAIRKNSHHCMIAEAIKEQVEGAQQIMVDLQSIRWTDARLGVRYFYFTPPQAQQALLKFDKGEEVPQFDLELRQPTMVRPRGIATTTGLPYEPRESKQRRQKVAPKNRVVKRMTVERQFGVRCLVEEEGGK